MERGFNVCDILIPSSLCGLRNRIVAGASSDTPTMIPNSGLSLCQPIPAPARYSLTPTCRKASFSQPAKFEGPQIKLSELRRQARFCFFADDLLLVPEAARLTCRKPLLRLGKQCALASHQIPSGHSSRLQDDGAMDEHCRSELQPSVTNTMTAIGNIQRSSIRSYSCSAH